MALAVFTNPTCLRHDPGEEHPETPARLSVVLERLRETPRLDVRDAPPADLEPVLRDAVVLALPFQPLCRDDCPGLCAECGARLADDPDHGHGDAVDPRWAALQGLLPGDRPEQQAQQD